MFQNTRSVVEVRLASLIANYREVKRLAGKKDLIAVVKGDGYGHGAVEVAQILYNNGVRQFAVSSISEALLLRAHGIQAPILLISGLERDGLDEIVESSLTPVLHSYDDIRWIGLQMQRRSRSIPFHLEIDTGLTRLGSRETPSRLTRALHGLPCLAFEGLMTHFASAGQADCSQREGQIRQWSEIESSFNNAGFKPRYRHMQASTALALQVAVPRTNVVRIGSALFGSLSFPDSHDNTSILHLEPILTWRARVLMVKTVERGSLVGYGASYRVPNRTNIGVVAVGYADGIPPGLSNRGYLLACGKRVPILGAVSMDLTVIDLGLKTAVLPGDWATILGKDGDAEMSIVEVARTAGIPTQAVACGISKRVARIYRR